MLTHYLRMFSYGTSYRIATMMFPRTLRDAVLKLYSFVRVPDNIVDEICRDNALPHPNNLQNHYEQAKQSITTYYKNRKTAYQTNDITHPIFGEYVTLFKEHNISIEYADAFFESMLMDCDLHRYESYEDLDHYMYGSAAVVGLMMCQLMGEVDQKAIPYAHALGDAMQMTNFLRDIREDFVDLDRIYLPSNDLAKFGLSHRDIQDFCSFSLKNAKTSKAHFCSFSLKNAKTSKAHCCNNFKDLSKRGQFVAYMQDQIAKIRLLYRKAEQGYHYLPKEGRRAVELSAQLYEGILDKIESIQYDVFTHSARTSFLQKLRIVIQYFFKSG